MNIKESCKYNQAFFIKKTISVQKTNISEEPNNTAQNGKLSRDECMCPEDYQKMILDSCWSTSQRWAKAVEQLIENDLNAPGKTIKKGIISDIFSFVITDIFLYWLYVCIDITIHVKIINIVNGIIISLIFLFFISN